ncbi:MAG: ABC transporter permease [Tannerellaceae bacterium]|nr:ABC transporter permease [Tannerellaceae bacterium]
MLGYEILMDNNLGNLDGYYLNEQSFLELEIADDVPSILIGEDWNLTIAGKVKNFQLRNISYNKNPVLLQLKKVEDFFWGIWNILVEVQGDPGTAYSQVKDVYERISRLNFDGKFIDQQITESFAVQKRTSNIVMIFTFVAILISLLAILISMVGVFGLVMFETQYRKKEIGIRKVMGVSIRDILVMFNKIYLHIICLCFVVAAPVAYVCIRKWLENFAFKTPIYWWGFVLAFILVATITMVTVTFQNWKAVSVNPVHSIKTE